MAIHADTINAKNMGIGDNPYIPLDPTFLGLVQYPGHTSCQILPLKHNTIFIVVPLMCRPSFGHHWWTVVLTIYQILTCQSPILNPLDPRTFLKERTSLGDMWLAQFWIWGCLQTSAELHHASGGLLSKESSLRQSELSDSWTMRRLPSSKHLLSERINYCGWKIFIIVTDHKILNYFWDFNHTCLSCFPPQEQDGGSISTTSTVNHPTCGW